MKKYIPLTDGQELEIKVWYGRDMRVRGYYLSVTPVTRERGMISFTVFSGETKLVHEVTRKSAKAERDSVLIASRMEDELIAKVLEKEKLTIKEGATK